MANEFTANILTGERNFECGGGCCKDFILPLSPEELAEDAKREQSRWRDGAMMHEMLIYLGFYPEPKSLVITPNEGPRHHWSCKFIKDGRCTVYERRPLFCRSYPDAGVCRYHVCRAHSWLRRWPVTRPLYLFVLARLERLRNWRQRRTIKKVKTELAVIKQQGTFPGDLDRTETGHTNHCNARMKWGDGECECGVIAKKESV